MARSILLVDGSPIMRDAVAQRLRAAGYEVHGASDAFEAVELLEGANVDLIVLEPALPRGCGVEFLRRLRSDALFKILPVIIYTRSDDPVIARQIAKLKTNAYIYKDRSGFDELLASIDELTQTKRTSRKNKPSTAAPKKSVKKPSATARKRARR